MNNHSLNKKEQLILQKKSRQYYSFLMLELLIALFLVGSFALPLAQFPMRSMKEQIKSISRMQVERLADIAFSEFKEKLYKKEISWKQLSVSSDEKAVIFDKDIKLSIAPIGERELKRIDYVSSIGKTTKQGEEWRLVTFSVKFQPKETNFKLFRRTKSQKNARVFSYQILVKKISNSSTASVETQVIQ
jgi:hypothetical protein